MTPNERKDYIANLMLKRGVNKNSIIAMLCNAYTESGRTFNPKETQWGGGTGSGIWMWSDSPWWQQVRAYANSHSEKEGIEWQVDFLISNRNGQWMPKNSGMSWDDFLHNTKNMDWKDLTYWFCWCWERPGQASQAYARQNNYNLIMPINWDGNAPDGGHETGNQDDNKNEDKKGFKFADCQSLFNKNRPNNNDQQPDNQPSGGISQGFNPKPCLDYFNKYKGSLRYSMPGRAGVFSGTTSDCSAFVSYMIELGYGLQDRSLLNTETLHGWLKGLGYKQVEAVHGSNVAKVPFKTGDVLILGQIGHSLGAAGHTGICLDAPRFFDCHGPQGGLGLGEYKDGNYFLYWHLYGNNDPWFYHYSKD